MERSDPAALSKKHITKSSVRPQDLNKALKCGIMSGSVSPNVLFAGVCWFMAALPTLTPVVPPLPRPWSFRSCCLDPRSCSRLSEDRQQSIREIMRGFLKQHAAATLEKIKVWDLPLFFLSSSLSAARIIRLSSKSVALSSWGRNKHGDAHQRPTVTVRQLDG